MNRDYPLSPTPMAGFVPVLDGVTVKKGPNRSVAKRTTFKEDGSKKVVKEVVNNRGYKVVRKVDGKRTELGKSY